MDCTVRGVGRQLAEVEGLVHDSLPSEGCIAVYQDGHHLCGTGLRSQWVIQQSLVCNGDYHVYAGSSDSLPRKGRGLSVYATAGISFVSLPCDYYALVCLANVSPTSVGGKVNNKLTEKKP